MASARQKVNPLQYWSSAMKEAAAMLPEGIDPNSAEGRKWIANHLRQQGIPSAAVDIGAAIESFNLKMLQTTDEKEKERIQKLINEQYSILESLLSGSVGGSSITNTVPYLGA